MNVSKSHIWNFFFFFGNIIWFREYNFLYSSTRFSGLARVFCEFLIFQQKVSKPAKTSKKDHSFHNIASLTNLIHFTKLNSLDIENNMRSQRSQKPFSLYKFSSQHFSVSCQKKYLPCINSSCPRTAYSRDVSILSGLDRLNNFLRGGSLFELVKCFTIFHFN